MTQAQRDNLLIAIGHLLMSLAKIEGYMDVQAVAQVQIALEEAEGKKRVM